jgi:Sulfotransferase family
MIVSYTRRFIFIRTRKVASTSVEVFLSQFCGEEDIIAPLSPAEEALGYDTRPRNFRIPGCGYSRTLRIFGHLIGRSEIGHGGFYNHMPAKEIRRLIGKQAWNSCYKISIERNPWDRQVSLYHWHYRDWDPKPSFDRFIRSPFLRKISPNFDTYAIDGKISADYICRYETLEEDLVLVLKRIGIDAEVKLHRMKSTFRDSRPWRDYYTPKTRDIVAEWYAREIAAFGYSF